MNLAEKKKKKLNELSLDDLKKLNLNLTKDVLKVFDLKNSVIPKNLMVEHLLIISKK